MALGARAYGVSVGLAVSAVLPSRWVLSGRVEGGALERAAFLLSSVAHDLAILGMPCAGLTIGLLLLQPARRWLVTPTLALATFSLWTFMVSSTESGVSRGIFPTWVDVRIMRDSPDMMASSLSMFLLARNVMPGLALVLPVVLLIRAWPRQQHVAKWSALGACLCGTAVSAATLLNPRSSTPHEGEIAGSPLDLFSLAMLREGLSCAAGPCQPSINVERAAMTAEGVAAGARMLGWPAPGEGCLPHPVARKLPSVEALELGTPHDSLVVQLGELSHEILATSSEPIHVFQIALEGMRGDDLHAINPAAPRELTPFLTSLYEQAQAREPGVFASRSTWTAGVRTPHGLAALACGLGTLPFGLALPRDLPELELRCLPDVLADAGFAVGHAYGGALGFDRIGQFLEAHGSRPWVSGETLPASAPRGAWGKTDRAVYEAAIDATPSQSNSYTLVLTLSHHHPFTPPEDLPEAIEARVDRAFSQATALADSDDRRRLVTLAYADEALAELFSKLAARGLLDRSIISIAADHSIPERPLWTARPGQLPALASRALIPMVVWVSPRFFEGARSPTRARALARDVQATLESMPLSQNDVPTIVLALLETTPALAKLGPSLSWHSLGGQTTSPYYAAPGPEATRVHGIHAGTALYFATADGLRAADDQPARLMVSAAEAERITPALAPAASALRAVASRHCPRAAPEGER